MKTKRMGRTGLKVSEVCLGTMTFGRQCDEATSHAIMDTAVEYGVNFFDTADVYPLGGASRLSWLPNAGAQWARSPTNAGFRASISSPRSRAACGGWRPTTSTCTR